MGLSESFSPDEKLESFRRQFHAGQVFYLFCSFPNRQKDKFLLLACASPHPLFFVINSNINEFKQKWPYLRDRQVAIRKSDYDFLDHDSYIDCTQAIESFLQDDVERQVLSDMKRIKGEINAASISEVIYAVEAARTLALRQKKWILKELNERIAS